MTREKKAVAVAYSTGVMDTLRVFARSMMVGDDKDKDILDTLVMFAMRRFYDILEADDGEEAE